MTVAEPVIPKRVILSMGGKGGVGKTNFMTGLAEWYQDHQIPVTLLDLDTENKARGSLTHFFGGHGPEDQRAHAGRAGCLPRLSGYRVRRSFWPTWAAAPAA